MRQKQKYTWVKNQSKNSTSNKVAKELKDRRYHQRVVNLRRFMTGKNFKITAEIVNGICPTCDEYTPLVGITKQFFRCITCGSDLEQKVNGKISYIPHLSKNSLKSKVDVFRWRRIFYDMAKRKFTKLRTKTKNELVNVREKIHKRP